MEINPGAGSGSGRTGGKGFPEMASVEVDTFTYGTHGRILTLSTMDLLCTNYMKPA